jgi:uncharacterized protein (DUF3820 family)
MAKKEYVPHLFIGIGKDCHFYTLRETYLHTTYLPGPGGNAVVNGVYQGTAQTEERSFHHFNLSQDADEAYAKAVEAAANFGLKLGSTRDDLDTQMNDIQRATAEQLAKREADRLAWEADRKAMREAELQWKIEKTNDGIFAFGKYIDKPFAEADPSYLGWFVDTREDFEAGSLLQVTADAILRLVPDLLPVKPEADKTVGEIGKRIEVNVTVLRVFSFWRDSFSGYGQERVYITTMVTDDRACVVVKSGAFCPEVGASFKLRGTVKEYSEYKGQMQTVLQRVKVI